MKCEMFILKRNHITYSVLLKLSGGAAYEYSRIKKVVRRVPNAKPFHTDRQSLPWSCTHIICKRRYI